jgi:23S rRNA (adenine2030-N6)-methyltransferase
LILGALQGHDSRMNYRHIYHAGNFADVMKHLALALVLEHLKKKDAPFCALDAHGGTGLYDLGSAQAMKTGEWQDGIGRFATDENFPQDFRLYFDALRHEFEKGRYPGSPLQIASALRPQDRLIANELHPADFETLTHNLSPYRNVRVSHQDAYEFLRAHLPPDERRGLILIDPPFEKKDEFEQLIHQMAQWKKRFAQGIYMLWYPVKPHLGVKELKKAASALGVPRTWHVETMIHPARTEGVFNGCGLILFNAPFQLPERYDALLPYLLQKMGFDNTSSGWLTPP